MVTSPLLVKTVHASETIRFRTWIKTATTIRYMKHLMPIISNPDNFPKNFHFQYLFFCNNWKKTNFTVILFGCSTIIPGCVLVLLKFQVNSQKLRVQAPQNLEFAMLKCENLLSTNSTKCETQNRLFLPKFTKTSTPLWLNLSSLGPVNEMFLQ